MTAPTTGSVSGSTGGPVTRPAAPRPAGRRPASAPLLVSALLGILALLGLWALTLGAGDVGPADALRAVVGAGDGGDVLIVREWRLPRVLAAVLAGAAFGCSGALLQAVLRNPLASPDIVGVTMGATTAAVAVIVLGVPAAFVSLGALGGALASAGLLLALAGRHEIGADRLVLVGIGLHTALYATKTFLIVRFPEDVARTALIWTIGTLYNRDWTDVIAAATALAVLLPLALRLLPGLGVLTLGDELAAGLGLRVRLTRTAVVACAVALAAVGVALGGPLPFIALAVPHLARVLTRRPLDAWSLVVCAALGAVVLLLADIVAEHALPTSVPAGVITASIGAPLFFWLLWRHHRTGSLRGGQG